VRVDKMGELGIWIHVGLSEMGWLGGGVSSNF